jgi:stage II sporulation protein P
MFITFLLAVACFAAPLSFQSGAGQAMAQEQLLDELGSEELKKGRYFYMIDEKGRTLLVTGHRLKAGDRYLTSGNDLYEVIDVEGYLARARFVEKVRLIEPPDISNVREPLLPVQKQGRLAYKIAVYHSHNAESYVPSDGTDSIYGAGGIHDVGLAFKEALEKKGIDVLYSDQLHLPHDRGAYRRSRVTALRLLRQRPDAIFDLHRDAAPWETYALELNGEPVTQIQIVVGLSNPGTATNQQFAYDLKGYADRLYPDLIHGVLTIWGSYNQDLSPLSLLLEVGAHTNTKESAQRGIERFADVVSYYFYGPAFLKDSKIAPPSQPPGGAPAGRPSYGIMRAVSGTVVSLLLAALGAALGFYYLNNPGALIELVGWWKEFPKRAAASARQFRDYLKILPAALKITRRLAPFNLRRAWRQLRREGQIIPRLLRAFISGMLLLLNRGLEAAAAFWAEAPQNLRRSWQMLRRDSRILPGLLRGGILFMRETAGRLGSRITAAVRDSGKNLRRAWNEAGEEAGVLIRLLRERLFLLRNRLRP